MYAPTHDHTAELDDGLDFINTLEHSAEHDDDHLPTLTAAVIWLVGHGVLHEEDVDEARRLDERDPGRAATLLGRIRTVRSGLREIYDATVEGRPAAADAIAVVNTALASRQVIELERAANGVRVGHRHGHDALDEALARLAEAVVRELTSPDRDRLRVCANDACRWVFRDASPAGRRRWCSMASCGNRAKAARHRARAKAGAN